MLRGLLTGFLSICTLDGAAGLFIAYQLQCIQQQATTEAQTLTLQELIGNSRDANAHVTLTNFRFGKPIIETKGHAWQAVWLPLYDRLPAEATRPPVLMKLTKLDDQADLDEFLKKESLTAVVCGRGLPALGSWHLRLPAQFVKEYPVKEGPEQEKKRTILLAEAELETLGSSWGPEVVLEPSTQTLAWCGGGVLVRGMAIADAETASSATRLHELLDALLEAGTPHAFVVDALAEAALKAQAYGRGEPVLTESLAGHACDLLTALIIEFGVRRQE